MSTDYTHFSKLSFDNLFARKGPGQEVPVMDSDGNLFAPSLLDATNVKYYGAVGDASTDDTTAIRAAITAAQASGNDRALIYFPECDGYNISGTITVPAGFHVIMRAPLRYTGSANEPAFVYGDQATNPASVILELWLYRTTISDWSNENCVGARLYNLLSSQVRIHQASRFTIGVQSVAQNGGLTAYNNFNLGEFYNNKIGLDITANTIGANNQNTYIGGRFTEVSSLYPSVTRYGIRIGGDGTYTTNNQNVFLNPSIELYGTDLGKSGSCTAGSATITGLANTTDWNVGDYIVSSNDANISQGAVIASKTATTVTLDKVVGATGTFTIYPARSFAFDLQYANQNTILYARSETTVVGALVREDSQENYFVWGYSDYIQPYVDITDRINITRPSRSEQLFERIIPIFECTDLVNQAVVIDSNSYFMIPGLSFRLSVNSTLYNNSQTALSVTDDYISLPTTSAVGITINTEEAKKFIVSRGADTSSRGARVIVKCFDAAGALLTNADAQHPYVKSRNAEFFYTTTFGGNYQQGSDSAGMDYFEVKPEVKSIWVGIGQGSSGALLKSFSVYTADSTNPRALPGYSGYQWTDRKYATQAPTAGTYSVGELVWNSVPASGSPIGWVCTAAGAPGTWVALPDAGDFTVASAGSTPNAAGASVSGNTLTLQPASGSFPGIVSTTTQTFQGNKFFDGQFQIGTATLSTTRIARVSDGTTGTNPLTGTVQRGFDVDIRVKSGCTAEGGAIIGRFGTEVASFTVAYATTFYESAIQKGSGSTITRYSGLRLQEQTTAVAANTAAISDNEAFSGDYFINSTSTRETLLSGNLRLNTAGRGLLVKEGSNARMGVATLVGGTIAVANTSITATTRIFLTVQTAGGTQGFLSTTRVASTSFTINSSSGTDTSTVAWMLVEPA